MNLPPHSFLPILLPASMEYLAVEMGVWMAGHAIVPMGMTFPPERVEHIKKHCEGPLVIDSEMVSRLAASPDAFGAHEPLDMESNALLIYTSGSTGEPKGILHDFESIELACKYGMRESFRPDSVWGSAAPFYFIAGVTIHFNVLIGGGELHLYDDEVRFDVQKMADYVADHGITHTFISPSVLPNFHNHSKSLKYVFAGSEKLSMQTSREGYKLYNSYGMSEVVGGFCPFLVERPYDSTPIGRIDPKSPIEYRLIDEEGKPVSEGEEGELILKGTFAKEYYKDPERTAQLLRDGWLHTGDIMRELPDGNLLYINRKDWMVKINGQRVEPGEVESAMKRIDGVKEAIVKGFKAKNGSQYICGYYTAVPDSDIAPQAIRDILIKKLPSYMVPLHILKVERFSLLPNGKANRKILLPPETSELQSTYVAPSDETEKILCDAFAKVFKMERAGIDDDFFLLGGDSIKVMSLQQMSKGLALTSKLIYKGRTPRKIAELCRHATGTAMSAVPTEPVPLSQTQMGIFAESMARRGEAAVFLPALAAMGGYLQSILAPELWQHILWSTLPWYLAGIAAYLLTAWIALEPTWGRRLIDGAMALLLLRLYFLAPAPEAYNGFLPLLTAVTLCYGLLAMLSLTRFRDGRQD